MKQKTHTTLIHTRSGRVGVMTQLDADLVWGIFHEKRPDGTTALGEEVYSLDEVRLERKKLRVVA